MSEHDQHDAHEAKHDHGLRRVVVRLGHFLHEVPGAPKDHATARRGARESYADYVSRSRDVTSR